MSLNNATVKLAEEVGYERSGGAGEIGRHHLCKSDARHGFGGL